MSFLLEHILMQKLFEMTLSFHSQGMYVVVECGRTKAI